MKINLTIVAVDLPSAVYQDLPPGGVILISTYTMMAYSGKRSAAAAQIVNQIREREWGLLIFDEVQFAPAPAFRKVRPLNRVQRRHPCIQANKKTSFFWSAVQKRVF